MWWEMKEESTYRMTEVNVANISEVHLHLQDQSEWDG
jgi:hypothetical protein